MLKNHQRREIKTNEDKEHILTNDEDDAKDKDNTKDEDNSKYEDDAKVEEGITD